MHIKAGWLIWVKFRRCGSMRKAMACRSAANGEQCAWLMGAQRVSERCSKISMPPAAEGATALQQCTAWVKRRRSIGAGYSYGILVCAREQRCRILRAWSIQMQCSDAHLQPEDISTSDRGKVRRLSLQMRLYRS